MRILLVPSETTILIEGAGSFWVPEGGMAVQIGQNESQNDSMRYQHPHCQVSHLIDGPAQQPDWNKETIFTGREGHGP